MPYAAQLALTASGAFLLAGLVLGVWKYASITRSPERQAHPYVDIAHRAALLYSFACLVMMKLVEHSPYSAIVQLWAVAVPVFFFAVAVASYVWHGYRRDTDNQFRKKSWVMTWGMLLLIVGEIGGVGVLFWGFISSVWSSS
jgi:hypothetical protein